MHLLLGGLVLSGVVTATGYLFDKVGEGVNDASNGVVKIAIAGGATYLILKKAKVL